MKRFPIFSPCFSIALSVILASATRGDEHHHHHGAHTGVSGGDELCLHDLDVTIRPQYNGTIEVEQRFRIEIDGDKIKHGPVLNYLTVFRSTGGLVLDSKMAIKTVTRDGTDEPFRFEYRNGMTSLFIGRKGVVLEPGAYDYLVRYQHMGTWKDTGSEIESSFDVTEVFRDFRIERAKVRLVLPEGAEFRKRSVTITGTTGEGPGFTKILKPDETIIETTSPLHSNHFFLLNTAWSDAEFSNLERWKQIALQHPRIPLSLIASVILLLSLRGLFTGSARRKKERRVAARAETNGPYGN